MREGRNNSQGSLNIYWTEKVLKFELQNSVKCYVKLLLLLLLTFAAIEYSIGGSIL
jgi:hypothetical protein